MSEEAGITIWTLLIQFYKVAHFCVIHIAITLSIFRVVIVDAVLMIVVFGDVARGHFEDIQIQMLNRKSYTLTIGAI